MKRPRNRMESVGTPGDVVENRVEVDQEEPKEAANSRGIRCKWCKTPGKSVVRKTYPGNVRRRFCLACKREFTTREVPI